MRQNCQLTLIAFFSALCGFHANADVSGLRTDYKSPNGLTESCVRLTKIPGGTYSAKDEKSELEFCAVDLYANSVAMCPKTWSTAPGTMIYDTEGLSQSAYEQSRCSGKHGHVKIAKFKNSMNASDTSSTFSASSLLYYHFSRYFDTTLDVPVSVFRTIDRRQHFERVSKNAVGLGRMNPAGWARMRSAELDPSSYSPTDELFTPDREQIFGILLKDKGVGYGPEIDGTQAHGWGSGQNNDFQQTPGFMALRSEKDLGGAIREGLSLASQDPIIRNSLGPGVSDIQMVYWMKELTETTLLDYIFSQQDRIENIDFIWEWTYSDGSSVKSVKIKDEHYEKVSRLNMSRIPLPPEIASFHPVLLQRTVLGDNDAGGRVGYTNFTKRTQMLEKIRHYSGETYRKLIALDLDFSTQGSLYRYAKETFGLTLKQLAQVIANTHEASAILKSTCRSGNMRFDLDPKKFLLQQPTLEVVDCDHP